MLMKKSLGMDMESSQQQQQQQRDSTSAGDDKQHFYDKNISFFDRISCEANEKTQKKPVNWKEERKLNAETFGVKENQMRYFPPYSLLTLPPPMFYLLIFEDFIFSKYDELKSFFRY